jgi:CBS domain-containing protein
MSTTAKVKDYMTKNVITVNPDTPNEEVIKLMRASGHDGFPVKTNGEVIGMITAFDLIIKPWEATVEKIMSTDIVVANQEMPLNDAARVMFRMDLSRLPVINNEFKLIGIITNTDVVRSHIERSTPKKVNYFKETFEQLYGIQTKLKRMKIPIKKLRPTHIEIYADELQSRTYELKNGLAEPIIVIKVGNRYVLINGHHRTLAALKLGYKQINSYLITLNEDIKLGIEKTADKNGIHHFGDIKIIDDATPPHYTI